MNKKGTLKRDEKEPKGRPEKKLEVRGGISEESVNRRGKILKSPSNTMIARSKDEERGKKKIRGWGREDGRHTKREEGGKTPTKGAGSPGTPEKE